MAKVKRFDKKSVRIRANVRNYRRRQKLKALHEKYVYDRIYTEKYNDKDVPVEPFGHDSSLEADLADLPERATEITDKLKYWAVQHRITKMALNDLLRIQRFAGLHFLPKDSRTLMGTPVNVPINILSKGKLWYYGVEKCLGNVFNKLSRDVTVTLDFNFDGCPISKSSNTQFWPILSSIQGMCAMHIILKNVIFNDYNC